MAFMLCLCVVPLDSARSQDTAGVLSGSGGESYSYRAWTTQNGLPQASVHALTQTRDGYLWLATYGGLVRFNGVEFQVFDVAGHPELVNNRMISLYEDRRETLWVGHWFGGLSRFDGRDFIAYGQQHGLPPGNVWAITEDLEDSLWVGASGGLARWRGGAFDAFTERDGLPSREILSLAAGRDGDLWIGTAAGLARRDAAGTFTAVGDAPPAETYAILEDPDGILWVDSAEGLLRCYRGRWQQVLAGERSSPSGALALDRQGQLWFSSRESLGLYRFTARDRRAPRAVASELIDLPSKAPSLFVDREDNLWAGTFGMGLWRLRRQPVTRWTTEHGLTHHEIRVVTADGEGGLWIASDCEMPLTRWRAGAFNAFPAAADGATLDCVGSFLRDRRGDLWLGAGGRLVRLREGAVVERHALVDSRDQVINAIFEDRAGRLWIGFRGHGLARFDRGDVTFYTRRDGLASDHVHFFAEDREGTLWIGTSDGLSRFADGVFSSMTREDGLPAGMVRAIHPDSDGTLWVGTYGGGLGRLRHGELTRITMDDGLYDNVITRILEDDRGNLWMLGNRGLFFVHRDQLNAVADGERESVFSTSFGRPEGMTEGSGARQPAGWRTDDGKMWLPTVDGLAMIDARNFRANAVAPLVMIEGAAAGRRALVLERSSPAIVLDAGERDLEIRYAASSFTAPEKVRFRYRMRGYDEDWLEVGTRRAAYYTNLSPGAYVFQVTAANHHGVWNDRGASLRIAIRPPFWATWWFRALGLTLVIGLLWSAHRVRLRVQEQRAEREKAAERKRLIAELRGKNTELERFVYSVSHDLKSPLVTIQGFLGFLERDLGSGDDERVAGDLGRLRSAARKMQRLIDDLLELSKVGREAKPPEDVALAELAGEVRELLAGEIAESGAEVTIRSDLPVVRGNRTRLHQLLQNLMQNALRYMGDQPRPRVEVGMRPAADGRSQVFYVRDNGVGIAPRHHDTIFKLFQRLDAETAGTGVGLALAQRIVEVHGGRIWVESEGEGHGSTFCFTLPG